MEVLTSRIMLRPVDLRRSQAFYRDVVGLSVYREFGDPAAPGVVFHLGGGLLEVSHGGAEAGHADVQQGGMWWQVRDVAAEHERLLAAGVTVLREPRVEPWGLVECWIADPDGMRIVLVQIPEDHPIRRDQRPLPGV